MHVEGKFYEFSSRKRVAVIQQQRAYVRGALLIFQNALIFSSCMPACLQDDGRRRKKEN